jgi:hypothetical protein
MCMPTSEDPNRRLPRANSFRKPQSQQLPFLSKVASIVIILFIFTYLGRDDSLDMKPENKSLFPYLLVLAFLITIPGNLLASLTGAIHYLKALWSKSSLQASLSSGTLRSLSRITSSETLARLSRVHSTAALRKLSRSIRSSLNSYRGRVTLKAITRKQCFARRSYIGQLSVTDILILYRYATDVNQIDFNKKRFMAEQSKLIRSMVTAIDLAVTLSRGGTSQGPTRIDERKEGDIDALYFIAVTRIFAEWRTLRLVLKGNRYRGYTASVKLGSRDMIQNLSKIEDGVHSYLKHFEATRQDGDENSVPSPTLRQLLQYEKDTQVHRKLPRLTEKSVASGLLWTKRQINYQLAIFRNILKVPLDFPMVEDAAKAAYSEVYECYHNWALKQIFSRTFGMLPPLDDLFLAMNPPENRSDDLSSTPDLISPLSDDSEEEEEDEDEDDNEFLAALDNFGKQVACKWEEFLGHFNCLDDKKRKAHPHNLIQSSESYLDFVFVAKPTTSAGPEVDHSEHATTKPLHMAKAGARDFVQDMLPLLNDFDALLAHFHMNDTSRI